MNKSGTRKKSMPVAVKRFIVPAILILLLIAISVVFVVTFLSIAGLTPGA
jgi:hypothetical protein